MNKLEFLKKKIVIFTIQILILSLFIYFFAYNFLINFDKEISNEQKDIIQFIANYVQFDSYINLIFIYSSWTIVLLIPVFIFNDFKRAYSMNLTTFFFPNFFFYVFLSRYSPKYFNSNFHILFSRTIILGLFIAIFSIGLSLLLKRIKKSKIETQLEDLKIIMEKNILKCPNCGTTFNSIPKFCFNCNKELILEE